MPELHLNSGTEEVAKSSGGSGFDIMGLLDEVEEAQERLKDNPQLAQMLGIDLGDLMDTGEGTETDGKDHGVPLNADTLLAMLKGVEQQGFADKTVTEIREWVESNPKMVDDIIKKQGNQENA